jgi:hypothetical protein
MPEIAAIRAELTQLASAYAVDLPPTARSVLQRFLKSDTVNASTNERYGFLLIVPFAVFRSEFEYLIRDHLSVAFFLAPVVPTCTSRRRLHRHPAGDTPAR